MEADVGEWAREVEGGDRRVLFCVLWLLSFSMNPFFRVVRGGLWVCLLVLRLELEGLAGGWVLGEGIEERLALRLMQGFRLPVIEGTASFEEVVELAPQTTEVQVKRSHLAFDLSPLPQAQDSLLPSRPLYKMSAGVQGFDCN